MKVAIASTGRFHVLDLARELDRQGLDVAFHSYVPRKRAQAFGLPARCHRSMLPYLAPLVAWERLAPRARPAAQERAMAIALNAVVTARLQPCDVFICMSGMYLEAARFAKERYGAQVWLERGSRHILSQRDILREVGARGPTQFIVDRELAGYELADRIVVPSSHVVESFAEHQPGVMHKLFVNPYGVDLDQFPQRTVRRANETPTILFVGGWSKRKGADLLEGAIRQLNGVRLLHVGAIIDTPFPSDDTRFTHVDPVAQWKLSEYYRQSDVFALASREEGLAMVQVQALASGLALVCTHRTGGADLALSPKLADQIFVASLDPVAIAKAIEAAVQKAALGPVRLEEADRDLLSWRAYASRYGLELSRVRKTPPPDRRTPPQAEGIPQ
ncbi:MAG: glycosyltransferase family 4 protein [Telluria sp.]|nr:glycosyltransferase family 4 protein [Telluria sp.]